jgi:hypothetical protein
MTDFTALEAALAAWQDSRNEDDRVKAQQAFESLPLGHQNLILDDATVGRLEGGDLLECIWQSWHGDEATTWLKELQQCRLTMSDTESLGIGIYDDLEQLAHSVLSDPQSCHYGSRLWVQEGNVLGAQQVSSCTARFGTRSSKMQSTITCRAASGLGVCRLAG